jgi:predicted nucleic acid-binding protein
MIVVADSSPLHYLILVEQATLLQSLYSEVVIPEEVLAELSAPEAPPAVVRWLLAAPPWLKVVQAPADRIAGILESLDLGERAAIAVAEFTGADLLLIDEAAGRAEARRRQIRVTGTFGVIRAAAENGLINVPDVLRRLKDTNFYVDEALIDAVFERWCRE